MSFSIENVSNPIEKVGEVVKKKPMLFVVGGVVIAAGLVFLMRNKSQSVTRDSLTTDESYGNPIGGSGGGGGGVSSEDLTQAIDQATAGIYDNVNSQLENINQTNQVYNQDLAQQISSMNAEMYKNVEGLMDKYKKINVNLDNESIYVESRNAPIVASPSYSSSSSSSSSSSKSSNGYTSTPSTGYGGINYNTASESQKAAISANENRISTDSSYRQSEIARAQQVIANREAAGMDTSEQHEYLNHLNSKN